MVFALAELREGIRSDLRQLERSIYRALWIQGAVVAIVGGTLIFVVARAS